jgi:hypothetical protein
VAAVRPETTSGGTIARRSLFGSPAEMDRRPEPRTRSRQTKLRRGPGSLFCCLVEQGYGVCGARDERPHAGQQQQLVDQLDATCRVTIRSASRSASQPRCACASLGASSFAGYVRSLKRDDGNCMAEVLLRPRGVRPQRPGNRVSSRPPILSDAASPVAVLFQTIPNFIQPGPGAVVIQFSSRGATCADRSNRLIPELDHNSTAKEHDVRQLR